MNEVHIEKLVKEIVEKVIEDYCIPIEVSARHVHLSQEHVEKLFGKGYELSVKKDLSQPGQFQYVERINLIGPKGIISGVSILGPSRDQTQIELSMTDAIKLGIQPPVRESGDLKGSETLLIAYGMETVKAKESVILAKRHIHMQPQDALRLGVRDNQRVNVKVLSQRPIIFQDVTVRVNERYMLNMHVDYDEANCAGCIGGGKGLLIP